MFDEFWKLYPRKVQRMHAEKAFKKATKRVQAEEILMGLRAQLASGEWGDRQYIPYPATWLNRGGWEVELLHSPASRLQVPDTEEEAQVYADLEGPSHPRWAAAIEQLRITGAVSPYDLQHWFMPTRGFLQDDVLVVGCLDHIHAGYLHSTFQREVDSSLCGTWRATCISQIDCVSGDSTICQVTEPEEL